jgi:hypothetical protein
MAPHMCNCILRADMAPQHLIFVVLVGKVPSLVDSVLGVVPGVSIPRGDVRFPCVYTLGQARWSPVSDRIHKHHVLLSSIWFPEYPSLVISLVIYEQRPYLSSRWQPQRS